MGAPHAGAACRCGVRACTRRLPNPGRRAAHRRCSHRRVARSCGVAQRSVRSKCGKAGTGGQPTRTHRTDTERHTGSAGTGESASTARNEDHGHAECDHGRERSSAAPTPPQPGDRDEDEQPTKPTRSSHPPGDPTEECESADRSQAVAAGHHPAPVVVEVECSIWPCHDEDEAGRDDRAGRPGEGVDEAFARKVGDHPCNKRQGDVDDPPPERDLGLQTPPGTHRRPHPETDGGPEGQAGHGSEAAAVEAEPVEHDERDSRRP